MHKFNKNNNNGDLGGKDIVDNVLIPRSRLLSLVAETIN
jgi:hypothetical protein